MSTTKIYSDLFQNDGSGEKLLNNVVPLATSLADKSSNVASTEWTKNLIDTYTHYVDIFVDANNGNDNNDGRTSSTAVKTIGKAVDGLLGAPRFQSRTVIPIINVASGFYNENIMSSANVVIRYNFASGATVASCYFGGGRVILGGNLTLNGRIGIDKGTTCSWGATWGWTQGLTLRFADNMATDAFVYLTDGSKLFVDYSSSITYGANSSVSYANFAVIRQSYAYLSGLSFTGSVTGQRYRVFDCSCIKSTGSTTKIPGTVNGTTGNYGYYD